MHYKLKIAIIEGNILPSNLSRSCVTIILKAFFINGLSILRFFIIHILQNTRHKSFLKPPMQAFDRFNSIGIQTVS